MLGSLNKLLGSAVNTVNNDVVHPVQGALHQLLGGAQPQQPGFTPAPMQKINLMGGNTLGSQLVPQVQQQAGNDARLNAQAQLGFTPAFTQNLANANPYVGQTQKATTLKNTSGAGAQYLGNQQPNQIVLGNSKYGQDPTTVLHEGLHRVYDTNPQVRQQFAQAYNQSATPAIKNYLTSKLYPYKGFSSGLDEGGVPIINYDLSNINSLPANLQNEVHSYLSELPSTGNKLPPALANYYKQYYRAQ